LPPATVSAESPAAVAHAAGEDPGGAPAGYRQLFWRRFRSDRIAMASGLFLAVLVLGVFVGEPVAARLLGHGPDDIFPGATEFSEKPVGPWTRVPDTTNSAESATRTTLFVLGSDGSLGRDEFLRLLKGGQVSLEIGFGSTLLALLIGVPLGAVAGLLGGWTDAVVSRLTEFFMGFPVLLLLVALGWTIRVRLEGVTLGGTFQRGALALLVIIGIFSWFYPARIVRARVLAMREDDYLDAARMVGASTWRIVRSHVFPHLVGPIAVYGSLIVATNIVLESAISFLNIGVRLPVASWGNMLSTNWGHLMLIDRPDYIVTSFWTTFWPAAAILMTVLALALFSEGVRKAFDPGKAPG
jgi:peptide/nickel transport system permease protein